MISEVDIRDMKEDKGFGFALKEDYEENEDLEVTRWTVNQLLEHLPAYQGRDSEDEY